jgi:hypothetical protein
MYLQLSINWSIYLPIYIESMFCNPLPYCTFTQLDIFIYRLSPEIEGSLLKGRTDRSIFFMVIFLFFIFFSLPTVGPPANNNFTQNHEIIENTVIHKLFILFIYESLYFLLFRDFE